MDDTTKIVLTHIQQDITEIKKTVKTISDRVSALDKHNAEEHATIHEKLKSQSPNKTLIVALTGAMGTLVGLVGYLVHTLH